jgi:hypothetical protein
VPLHDRGLFHVHANSGELEFDFHDVRFPFGLFEAAGGLALLSTGSLELERFAD